MIVIIIRIELQCFKLTRMQNFRLGNVESSETDRYDKIVDDNRNYNRIEVTYNGCRILGQENLN